MATDSFKPSAPFQSPFVQTLLASSRLRTLGRNPMKESAKEMIIETGAGIRLLGYYSPQAQYKNRGLVILLHGWEGSADSSYILSTGRTLYHAGYAIFRLNLRDHGKSHHLNKGLFFATLIEEVFQALRQVALMAKELPVFLAGFSLGGNFALRAARRCSITPIDNLKHVVSISPVLNPNRATDAIDGSRFIKTYFLKKWRRSLEAKQSHFPDLYDFREILRHDSIRKMTDILIDRYSDYSSSVVYFKSYAILGNDLRELPVPATIITSSDDPIIPVKDFRELEINKLTRLIVHEYGGHNGFIDGIRLGSWCDQKMIAIFKEIKKP